MRYGLPVSLFLHLAVLGWTLIAIENTPPLVLDKPEPVEISIVTDDDVVRLKQGERDSKNLDAEGKEGPAKEPPKKDPPKLTPPPPPPPPPQAAAPPPPDPPKTEPPKPDPIAEKLASAVEPPKAAPAPTPDDQKLIEEKIVEDADIAAKAKAAAEAKAKAEADAKAKAEAERRKKLAEEKRKKELAEKERQKKLAAEKAKAAQSLDSIVNAALAKAPDQSAPPKALIDKAPPKPAQSAGAKTTQAALKGPAAGAPEGTDTRLTADKLSMLGLLMRDNVKRCWNINAGMEGANKLVIKAQIKLGQDGRLVGDPVIVNTGSGPQFEDAANSARRALVDCQPYTNLPPDLYVGGWDFMALTFDPSKMF